ncbi:MAG TPA: DUF1496 domain-containing protein [Acidiferrobacterales bacterium]|jgi:hypothetical protein
MTAHHDTLQVGAPDPELRNSPIYDEMERDSLDPDLAIETGACYFNDRRFSLGDYVCSGDELLKCEERGVWVRRGSCHPA